MPAPPSDTGLVYPLQSSITVTVSGNSGAGVGLPISPNGYTFHFDLTKNDLAMGDTIDLKVQTSVDDTEWFDVCALTQATGTTAAGQSVMKIIRAGAEALRILDARFTTLVANSNKDFFGRRWRVRWIVVGGTADFTFSVSAIPI